jgi:hypothetical protein
MHHTLSQFVEISKDDMSLITCGVMAILTEFLGHFQGGIRQAMEGLEDGQQIDLTDLIGLQIKALSRCIADLQSCKDKLKFTGESH